MVTFFYIFRSSLVFVVVRFSLQFNQEEEEEEEEEEGNKSGRSSSHLCILHVCQETVVLKH
jgi:hypothetical protein